MTISALPTPPSRSDSPSDFSTKADAFLAALPTFQTEANQTASDVNDDASAAASSASSAAESASAAQTAQGLAEDARDAAAASAASALNAPGTSATSTTSLSISTGTKNLTIQTGKLFVQGQTLLIASSAAPATNNMWGQVLSYNSESGALSVSVVVINGSGTFADWVISLSASPNAGESNLFTRSISGASTITTADKGNLVEITGGTFTLGFEAAATLGDGFYVYVRNNGTGVVTLDPNGSEQIDGAAAVAIGQGGARLIVCDGVAFTTVMLEGFVDYQEFTSSGTWTKPNGCRFVYVEAIGGGGGGGNIEVGGEAAGGGGGGFSSCVIDISSITGDQLITIGAGGAGHPSGTRGIGSDGGDSSFGAILSARGGTNTDKLSGYPTWPGDGGGGELGGRTTSNITLDGNGGYSSGGGGAAISGAAGRGGNCVKGGGGGGGSERGGLSGAGGTSIDGGDGGSGNASSSVKGGNGAFPGGGGGASSKDGGGGDGADGRVRVWAW